MAFLGGFGTLAGPVLGALILEPLQQWEAITFTNGYFGEIALGVLFLLVILFMPRGIIPTGTRVPDHGGRPGGTAPRRSPPPPAARPRRPASAARAQPTGTTEHRERPMTALLRTDGVSKAFGGVQALDDGHHRGGRRAASPA